MWNNLKASIASVVRTNNNQEITGANLQSVLNTIVNSVGANATFAGVATPSTSPGTPDGPVFWIAGPGTYSNFGQLTVVGDTLGVFVWSDSAWHYDSIFNLNIDDEPTAGSGNLVKSGGVYSSLVDVTTVNTVNLNDSSIWSLGSINATTGEEDERQDRLRSIKIYPYFEMTEATALYTKVATYVTRINAYVYDKDDNYLGWCSTSITASSLGILLTSFKALKQSVPDAYSLRLVVFTRNVSSISGDISDLVIFTNPIVEESIKTAIDKEALEREAAINDVAFSTGEKINETGIDDVPTSESNNLVTSGGVAEKIHDSLIYQVDFTQKDNWVDGGTDTDKGIIDPSRTDRLSSKLIPFTPANIMLTHTTGVSFQVNVYCYDYKQDYLGLLLNNSSIIDACVSYPNAVYFRIGLISISGVSPISADNISNIISNGITYAWKYTPSKGFNDILIKNINNKIEETITTYVELNDSTNWVDGGTDTDKGIIDPSITNRLSTKMFQFNKDVVFSYIKPSGVSFSANIYCYDKSKKYLGVALNKRSISDCLASYPTAVWFRFGLININGVTPISTINIANIVIFRSTYSVKKYTEMSEFQELESSDKLYGKLWYACGDSFTAGVINDSPLPNGKYAGEKQVYPYFIGNRTGMEVMNIAVSGSTITYISGTSTSSNCFTYPSTGKLYTIPANAEYITLKFGINDSHKNVPIGTIDDETNTTLYGAWNVAISYLLNKCPFAKIGIIVTNGCDSPEYSQAGKDIAKKWGLSYLDENFGYEVPLLHRVNGKPLVCSEAHQNRMENFRVSANNTHPNNRAHEFESTFVEAWLRTL